MKPKHLKLLVIAIVTLFLTSPGFAEDVTKTKTEPKPPGTKVQAAVPINRGVAGLKEALQAAKTPKEKLTIIDRELRDSLSDFAHPALPPDQLAFVAPIYDGACNLDVETCIANAANCRGANAAYPTYTDHIDLSDKIWAATFSSAKNSDQISTALKYFKKCAEKNPVAHWRTPMIVLPTLVKKNDQKAALDLLAWMKSKNKTQPKGMDPSAPLKTIDDAINNLNTHPPVDTVVLKELIEYSTHFLTAEAFKATPSGETSNWVLAMNDAAYAVGALDAVVPLVSHVPMNLPTMEDYSNQVNGLLCSRWSLEKKSADCTKRLEAVKSNPVAKISLANSFFQGGNAEEARNQLLKLARAGDMGAGLHGWVMGTLTATEILLNKLPEARTHFNEVIKMSDSNVPGTTPLSKLRDRNLGATLDVAEGHYAKAETEAKAIRAEIPKLYNGPSDLHFWVNSTLLYAAALNNDKAQTLATANELKELSKKFPMLGFYSTIADAVVKASNKKGSPSDLAPVIALLGDKHPIVLQAQQSIGKIK